jgi:hypothetical protein
MAANPPLQRVEVRFVGAPPTRQIRRASGVSEVEVDGLTLRCYVYGSFQPFLEALRGHEVVSLLSTQVPPESLATVRNATGHVSQESVTRP